MIVDAAHWHLRGPVKSMRSDIAEWDAERGEWLPPRFFNFVVFDDNGRVVQLDQRGVADSIFRHTYSYDGSGRLREDRAGTAGAAEQHVTSYHYDDSGRVAAVMTAAGDGVERTRETSTYDERGRRTKVELIGPDLPKHDITFGVDGSEVGYGAPGATTITTRYDENGRSIEAVFHDAEGKVIRRVGFTRDAEGRVLVEETSQEPPFGLPSGPEMSSEDRAAMLALIAQAFGAWRTSNEYAGGRLMRRTQQMGALGEDHATYAYNERGDVAEEAHVSTNREMRFDPGTQPQTTPDVTRIHDARFSYEYDTRGNWTSRVVSGRFVKDGAFAPSNLERRTIEYYPF